MSGLGGHTASHFCTIFERNECVVWIGQVPVEIQGFDSVTLVHSFTNHKHESPSPPTNQNKIIVPPRKRASRHLVGQGFGFSALLGARGGTGGVGYPPPPLADLAYCAYSYHNFFKKFL